MEENAQELEPLTVEEIAALDANVVEQHGTIVVAAEDGAAVPTFDGEEIEFVI